MSGDKLMLAFMFFIVSIMLVTWGIVEISLMISSYIDNNKRRTNMFGFGTKNITCENCGLKYNTEYEDACPYCRKKELEKLYKEQVEKYNELTIQIKRISETQNLQKQEFLRVRDSLNIEYNELQQKKTKIEEENLFLKAEYKELATISAITFDELERISGSLNNVIKTYSRYSEKGGNTNTNEELPPPFDPILPNDF